MRKKDFTLERKSKTLDADFTKINVVQEASDGFPAGYVEGYASVFNNVDLVGDIVTPGAFAKTLRERLKKKMILLYDSHMVYEGTDSVIGVVADAKEDEYGLWFKAMFSSVQRAQDVRTKIREGILSAVSFGYDVLKADPGPQEGTQLLKELRLHEVSIVPWGANPKAQVEGVKDARQQADEDEAVKVQQALSDLCTKAALAAMTSRLKY